MHWKYENEEESKLLTSPLDEHHLHATLSEAMSVWLCTACIIVYTCAGRDQSLKIKSTSHAVLASHILKGACLGSLNAFLVCELYYAQVCAGVHTDRACVHVGTWYSELGVSALQFWMFKVNLKVNLDCALLPFCAVLAGFFLCMNSQFLILLHTSKSC